MQLENDRTVMKLRNDKLQSEVESKNRELAATTMSIVRKNELLMSIKEALLSSGNGKEVLPIVDDNINSEGDWEHFQEIFNQTDRDFLTRLKNLHPDLTPNDIKLCIYLRLNLSSKEIAPLLNISTQSVEIKPKSLDFSKGYLTFYHLYITYTTPFFNRYFYLFFTFTFTL